MARIALVNIGMHGHVNPTLGFTEELIRRGHDLYFLSTPEFESTIKNTGSHFIPYPSQIGKDIALTAKEQAETIAEGKAPPASALTRFLEEFAATFPELFKQLGEIKPDLIVYDFVSLAARIVAKHFGIKTIKFFTTYASNDHYDVMRETFAKHDYPTPEQLQDIQSFIDKICHSHGCESIPLTSAFGHIEDDNLVFMPNRFQPMNTTFDQRFHFVGPCLRSAHTEKALSLIPAGNGPVMLISLGSLYHEWHEFYSSCIEAFGNSSWRVVMAIGKQLQLADFGSIPANFTILPHIPQVELLEYADLFISHGGMNSTMEAMSFGVPMLVVPQIEEQELTATRLAQMGLGKHLKRSEVNTQVLKAGVEELLNNPEVIARVKELQSDIHNSGGSLRAANIIEECLPRQLGQTGTNRPRVERDSAPEYS